jgi:endonuclease/exonuclease/phosphatase (EEP) superfamily protein YafD
LIVLAVAAVLAGCISVPEAHLLVGRGQDFRVEAADSLCQLALPDSAAWSSEGHAAGPTAEEFRLLNWNLYKGWKPGWEKDLERLAKDADIVTLQEFLLQPDGFQALRGRPERHWVFAPAFRYGGRTAGVLTASSGAFRRSCMMRVLEPLLRIPKSVLITQHPSPSNAQWLWVANVHSINFTLGTERFREHWSRLMEVLASVEDPLIVVGDFNTWNEERMAIVTQATRRHGLTPVVFENDARTTVFGRAVDHVFYRGLAPVEAVVYEVSSSDHHPMAITFRWAK